MANFVQRGREKPKQELTKRRFREMFVKGIIEDDLPFSFGEREGMNRCFQMVLPQGYNVPNRAMVRCDLRILYDRLDEKITATILVSRNKHNCFVLLTCDMIIGKRFTYIDCNRCVDQQEFRLCIYRDGRFLD